MALAVISTADAAARYFAEGAATVSAARTELSGALGLLSQRGATYTPGAHGDWADTLFTTSSRGAARGAARLESVAGRSPHHQQAQAEATLGARALQHHTGGAYDVDGARTHLGAAIRLLDEILAG